MIDRKHDLSITKQAEVLKIGRGSVYYLPRPVSSADLVIMRHLDRLHLELPFAGSRMLRGLLALQGCKIGRRHVKTLMRRMGMEALFCVETLEDALARHGKPDIFNTDQGSQFTGAAFTGVLVGNGIAISMDGKGAWRDNVFVERLWRSVKYEEVYLRAYDSVGEARRSIGLYLDFYNGRRPHSSLDDMTPDQAYFNLPPIRAAA